MNKIFDSLIIACYLFCGIVVYDGDTSYLIKGITSFVMCFCAAINIQCLIRDMIKEQNYAKR